MLIRNTVLTVLFVALFPVAAFASSETHAIPAPPIPTTFVSDLKTAIEEIVASFGGSEAPSQLLTAPVPHRDAEYELRFSMTPEVKKYVAYYAEGSGRGTTLDGIERASAYRTRAEEIFAEEGVPTRLVWLAQVESGWKVEAVSPVGAGGVWQFMPDTARDFGMRVDADVDERLDFEKATRGSARYLRRLARRYEGNWELAIAAYNVGEGNVDKAVEKAGGVEDFWLLCREDLLPEETKNYVPKVLAVSMIGSDPTSYGLPHAG